MWWYTRATLNCLSMVTSFWIWWIWSSLDVAFQVTNHPEHDDHCHASMNNIGILSFMALWTFMFLLKYLTFVQKNCLNSSNTHLLESIDITLWLVRLETYTLALHWHCSVWKRCIPFLISFLSDYVISCKICNDVGTNPTILCSDIHVIQWP